MNLVTQSLLQQLGTHPMAEFVRWWDPFEAAVIRVYKTGVVLEEDSNLLVTSRVELNRIYNQWEGLLLPYWKESLLNGEPICEDPFIQLLTFDNPEAFIENWTAMQTLPVAREAINRYLWEQIS